MIKNVCFFYAASYNKSISGRKWEIMFFGSYQYTLDDKGRLVIPAKMRSESGPVLFAMRGFEHCLSLYTHATFSQLIQQVNSYDYNQANVRQYLRSALASVIELPIDDHGRVQIPVETLKQFQLEKTVKIIGINDHIEIWSASVWAKYEAEANGQFETHAANLTKK
jgi:MraZ protein